MRVKESEVCDVIEAGIEDHLDDITRVRRELVLCGPTITDGKHQPRNLGMPRCDFYVEHSCGKVTIIEVKNPNNVNSLAKGIGQLLVYKEVMECILPDQKVDLLLASTKDNVIVGSICAKLDIKFVHILLN